MGAAPQFATAMPRSGPRERIDNGNDRKPAKGAGKSTAECSGSAALVSGWRLPTHADVAAAVAWRLAGISEADVEALADVLRPFAGDFSESRPEVMAILSDLHRPGDRRGARTLAAAVLARDAERRGDIAGFLLAGFEVLGSFQQSQRRKHHNRDIPLHQDDALDKLIRKYISVDPDIASITLFKDFAAQAGGFNKVLVEFDENKEELVCQLNPKVKALTNITSGDFGRRMRRLR